MDVDWKKILIATGTGIAVYIGMRYVLPVAVPFLLGWFLAFSVLPAAKWIEKKTRLRRDIGGSILLIGLTVLLGVGLWKLVDILVDQVQLILEKRGLWQEQAETMLHNCCQRMGDYLNAEPEEIQNFLVVQINHMQRNVQSNMGTRIAGYTKRIVETGITVFGGFLVTIVFGIMVLKDMDAFYEKMEAGEWTGKILKVSRKIGKAGGQYLKTQGILMIIVSGICIFGLWLLKSPYFLLAGILVGVLDGLPVIGAGMILIPWALLWLLKGNYKLALGYAALYLAVDIARQFLEPKLLGEKMGMHPAVMLAAVYGGFFLFGVAGFFLGPVAVMIMKGIWEESEANVKKENTKY